MICVTAGGSSVHEFRLRNLKTAWLHCALSRLRGLVQSRDTNLGFLDCVMQSQDCVIQSRDCINSKIA